jgi:hypothetical protein
MRGLSNVVAAGADHGSSLPERSDPFVERVRLAGYYRA